LDDFQLSAPSAKSGWSEVQAATTAFGVVLEAHLTLDLKGNLTLLAQGFAPVFVS
jgi:hypothetical protein